MCKWENIPFTHELSQTIISTYDHYSKKVIILSGDKMGKAENRKEERVDVERLPENLQTLIINLNPMEKVRVNLTDASRTGVGFTSDADPSNYIVSTNIILYPNDETYPLFGKIVYAGKRDDNKIRVGVQIKETSALEKYREIIDALLSQ